MRAVYKFQVLNRNNKVVATVKTEDRVKEYCRVLEGLHYKMQFSHWDKEDTL